METVAKVNNLRGSARKARLVLDLIRGKKVSDAKKILTFSNKAVAPRINKLLSSAVANLTESDGKVDLDNIFVTKAFADDGPIMRRHMPRAQGRANIIRKRTCHITLGIAENKQEA